MLNEGPSNDSGRKKVYLGLTVDSRIKRAIRIRAAINGRSMSAEVCEMLAQALDDDEDPTSSAQEATA